MRVLYVMCSYLFGFAAVVAILRLYFEGRTMDTSVFAWVMFSLVFSIIVCGITGLLGKRP